MIKTSNYKNFKTNYFQTVSISGDRGKECRDSKEYRDFTRNVLIGSEVNRDIS